MNDTLTKTNGTAPVAEADQPTSVTLAPRVDVLENDQEYRLLLDLPGVKPGDVDIRFENGELTVHGRRNTFPGKPGSHREYDVANYYRTFRVTDQVAADKIEAELVNGVLTVHLPKPEAVKPRRIAVRG